MVEISQHFEERPMYVIRRVYEVKPGTARRVATLVKQQGDAYSSAGQRSEVRVYFNGGTVPGDNNRVYMEWTDETIDSPYREGASAPEEAREFGAEIRESVVSQHIEFFEMMIPAKMQDE
ncbi:MAG: hypothetical protein J4O01_02040 [Chloroflexi bacterium]|nr:hypothetical protein [Chloroflexota bacterium]MCI0850819.1 hypothetical protein [Chloroflexota bacterium]MCI0872724.1 hypothetical protein [Chloroflexota bacterium]